MDHERISQQEHEIAETRRLLGPTHVRPHRVPQWFAQRLKFYQNELGRGVSSPTANELLEAISTSC
jgi:hypothetical protein